jgi:bacteriocin-like protein
MADSGAVCDLNHSHGEIVEPQWPNQRRMVRPGLTDKIMRKTTKHNSEVRGEVREPKDELSEPKNELSEAELQKVSGGLAQNKKAA